MRDNRHFGGWVGTDYGKSALAGPGARGNTWHLGTQRGRPGGRGPCLRGACCDSSGCRRTKCRGQEREGKANPKDPEDTRSRERAHCPQHCKPIRARQAYEHAGSRAE